MDINSFFKISYGLYAVCTEFNSVKGGYIANTVFQVTAEPPRLAISCSKNNFTFNLLRQARKFSISVLHQNASNTLIGDFGYKSGRDISKFDSHQFKKGELNIPVITEGSIAYFECEIDHEFDVDTHVIFVGKVKVAEMLSSSQEPMTYAFYRDVKRGLSPKNAPTYIDKSNEVPAATPKDESAKKDLGKKYRCLVCGFVYNPEFGDPDSGIPPGTPFEDIPDDWVCPVCSVGKEDFIEMN